METKQTILGAVDPDVMARITSPLAAGAVTRRDALKRGAAASLSAKLALASLPAGLALMARDAFGQGSALPEAVIEVFNFALTLEYLEAEFYVRGVAAHNLIPGQDRQIFVTIRDHEVAHVAFLRSALGSRAVAKPTFDFTAGNGSGTGPFADVFTNYETFKAVAQAFEDTGVRAYKGQAPALQPYPDALTQALTIHSVEARHASEVRRLRGGFSEMEPNEGWITFNETDIPGTEPVYAGEENLVQGGVSVPSVTTVSAKEVSEAFDEPLTREQVLAIVDPFIV